MVYAELSSQLTAIVNGKLPVDFNWNVDLAPDVSLPEQLPAEPTAAQLKTFQIVDEGLRDGLHGALSQPSLEQRMEYIGLADQLGIKTMTVGIFSKDGLVGRTTKSLLARMRDEYPHLTPIVLSLATQESVDWATDCAAINHNLQTIVFMGTAPSRMLAEDWTTELVLKKLNWAVDLAVRQRQLKVIGATEHTTQTPPSFLKEIIKTQVVNGAEIFCIADTIGTARPVGAFRLTRWVKQVLKDIGHSEVLVDWHGHQDMGRSVDNSLMAIAAGADRVHAVVGGQGERAGNTPLEVLLINASQILREHGLDPRWDLSVVTNLMNLYVQMVGGSISDHGPLGQRSHVTSLGIHAAAMFKAWQLAQEARQSGLDDMAIRLETMANTIYTAVDPRSVGREHGVRVGPFSGASTVQLYALMNDMPIPDNAVIARVLEVAKNHPHELTPQVLEQLLANGTNHSSS